MSEEDKRLLKRLHNADLDALYCVYEKYSDDLLAVAVSLLSDIHTAEDCLHDVFVNLVSTSNDLKIRSNIKGYLISCVANRARDCIRKRVRQPDCPLTRSENLTTSNNPIVQLIESEESAQLIKALAQLPYEQREIFVLHAQAGMKFPRIAGLFDVSVNTVQSRYRYAIEKLQALLEKENDHEIRK